MKAGFTGTQDGMTKKQRFALEDLLDELEVTELHHGDCVGADEEVNTIALAVGIRIVLHPPTDPKKRAFCVGAAEVREEKDYLDRNHDIVDGGEVLLASPKSDVEKLRSGTWATVRYARKRAKDIFIISPSGFVKIGDKKS